MKDPSPYNPLVAAGELARAIDRDAPDEVIAAYRSKMLVGRAERALKRALEGAPPLRPEQIAHLRGVLNSYGSGDPESDECSQ